MSKNVGRLRGPFHHKDRLCIAERCMALRQYLLFQQIDLPTDLLADAAVCFFVSLPPGGVALAAGRLALPPSSAAAAPVIQNLASVLYGRQAGHTKLRLLYGWGGSGVARWVSPLSPPSRPRRALASPFPALPSPSGRLARSGALGPCAGGPPGVFRRLRAAGARSAPAPAARRLRPLTLASLAEVSKEEYCTRLESGAIIALPCAGRFGILKVSPRARILQGLPFALAKTKEKSRPSGRLSPYLDTLGGNLRIS